MLNVTFIRHAKSEWKSFDRNDFNRDISEIGMEKTKKIGSFLKKEKIILLVIVNEEFLVLIMSLWLENYSKELQKLIP